MSLTGALTGILAAAVLFAVYGLTARGRAAAPPGCGLCGTARARLRRGAGRVLRREAAAGGAAEAVPGTTEGSAEDDERMGGAPW